MGPKTKTPNDQVGQVEKQMTIWRPRERTKEENKKQVYFVELPDENEGDDITMERQTYHEAEEVNLLEKVNLSLSLKRPRDDELAIKLLQKKKKSEEEPKSIDGGDRENENTERKEGNTQVMEMEAEETKVGEAGLKLPQGGQ